VLIATISHTIDLYTMLTTNMFYRESWKTTGWWKYRAHSNWVFDLLAS